MRFTEVFCNGVTYHNYYLGDERQGCLTIDDEKVVLDGTFKITTTKDSIKYGKELQFQIFSPKELKSFYPKVRNPSNWNTTEINLPFSDIDKIIETLIIIREEIKNEKK